MKTSRLLAALVAVPLAGTVVGGAPAYAEPDPDLTVQSVEIDAKTVGVRGVAIAHVPVKVRAGFANRPESSKVTLNVFLERTGGSGPLNTIVSTDLRRTAGTIKDGTWTGTLNIVSTAGGVFKVSKVYTSWWVEPGAAWEPTPVANGPSVTIDGGHYPKVTATVTPKVVPVGQQYSIRWAVTDNFTGKPFSGISITADVDRECGPDRTTLVKTNTAGIYTATYQATDASRANCFEVYADPYATSGLHFKVPRLAGVSAVPSRTSAKVGTLVPVNGSVTGPPVGCKANLQRLYGASQWRTVGTANIRTSGRFTLTAQPAYRGKIPYRVLMPSCLNYVAASSKPFTITGV
ncbi:hypothetical protein GCM10029976_059990 [Kribbella albertanoniae]|uniref:Big-1 domain-containing protein n=1 Tax=Kribbella albertanoniae TaxID=1266829 RepID=A0A4R4QGX7_9ACTN|nr:hypothetical protein [Kribbella albertanoniae]TDC34877.1 hypothetical protein E1261_02965 [Kribbella albertanoniae]